MTKDVACKLPGLSPASYARWRASVLGTITERLVALAAGVLVAVAMALGKT